MPTNTSLHSITALNFAPGSSIDDALLTLVLTATGLTTAVGSTLLCTNNFPKPERLLFVETVSFVMAGVGAYEGNGVTVGEALFTGGAGVFVEVGVKVGIRVGVEVWV